MNQEHNISNPKHKILILGDKRVGKSSIRNFLLGRPLKAGQYSKKSVADVIESEVDDKTPIELFDFHDIEQLKIDENLQKQFLSNTTMVLIVFAINNQKSFEAIPEFITMVIKNNKKKLVPFALVGNKNDLREKDNNFIPYKDIADYVGRLEVWAKVEVPYFDISMKFMKGVSDLKDYIQSFKINPLLTNRSSVKWL